VRELGPGLWHWEAPHPQWRPTEPWSENVSSYAIDDGERLLLVDPLAVPSELLDLEKRCPTPFGVKGKVCRLYEFFSTRRLSRLGRRRLAHAVGDADPIEVVMAPRQRSRTSIGRWAVKGSNLRPWD
jgi:hypothetical protein